MAIERFVVNEVGVESVLVIGIVGLTTTITSTAATKEYGGGKLDFSLMARHHTSPDLVSEAVVAGVIVTGNFEDNWTTTATTKTRKDGSAWRQDALCL
jgi:hypothetical protein